MLETARTRKGYIKVRLYFETVEPKHIRSFILSEELGIEGPYFENICVLYPQSKSYPFQEVYLPAFNALKNEKLLAREDVLVDFCFLEEDITTQSYIID